ncbi:hypothetical protein AUJ84_04190 [Candidatus Pacearchaeota archaeon CG1_02_32_132]|nr:MAG: hypothetical protein AUJ84_04190 [Candidatus Pacearchaeota archaeon CG1_02_32_132]
MEKRLVLGRRVLGIRCSDECNSEIYNSFFKIIDNFSYELEGLMDEYELPEEVLINFKEGEGELYGFYYVQGKRISKNVIVIDIYTKPFAKFKGKLLNKELLDTFVHEIIHHSVRSEKETRKMVKEFMMNVKF